MGGKILVLEDEDAIRSFIRVNLKKQMFEIVEASSGEEALEKLDDTFDIALLDVMLPGSMVSRSAVRRERNSRA